MQNSDFWSRITSLYGSQIWPVVLCMYKSVLIIRIISLYGSQHSSVVFACKTAPFGPELHVSVCTRPHLSFCACNTTWLAPESLVSMGPSGFCIQNSVFWSRITTLYWSQTTPVVFCMQYSVISTRITCLYRSQWFLHEKQRLLEQNYNSLWVPDHTCRFLHVKQRQ